MSLEEGENQNSLAAEINESVDVFLGALKEIAGKAWTVSQLRRFVLL